jgi:siroheme synthase (precorrin-2 oxidase/ferrochelatase)
VVGIVVGGGDVTATDVRLLAAAGATVIGVSGTGGTADDLADRYARGDCSELTDVISWRATDRLRVVLRHALDSP